MNGLRRFVATAVIASLALGSPTLLGGCSLAFVRPAKKDASGQYQPAGCSTSRTAPVADIAITFLQMLRTAYALSLSGSDYRDSVLTRNTDIALGIALTTLFASSAAVGLKVTGTCREATLRVAREQAEDEDEDDDETAE